MVKNTFWGILKAGMTFSKSNANVSSSFIVLSVLVFPAPIGSGDHTAWVICMTRREEEELGRERRRGVRWSPLPNGSLGKGISYTYMFPLLRNGVKGMHIAFIVIMILLRSKGHHRHLFQLMMMDILRCNNVK